jgi:hypothetical protein
LLFELHFYLKKLTNPEPTLFRVAASMASFHSGFRPLQVTTWERVGSPDEAKVAPTAKMTKASL